MLPAVDAVSRAVKGGLGGVGLAQLTPHLRLTAAAMVGKLLGSPEATGDTGLAAKVLGVGLERNIAPLVEVALVLLGSQRPRVILRLLADVAIGVAVGTHEALGAILGGQHQVDLVLIARLRIYPVAEAWIFRIDGQSHFWPF